MKRPTVRAIRLFEVSLPLREPFTISGGTMASRRSLIVELHDSAGATGYGESAPFEQPFYSPETLDSARACLASVLLPRLLGQPVLSTIRAHDLLTQDVRGNAMARAGPETAWWDLYAAQLGESLGEVVTRHLSGLDVAAEWLVRRPAIECGVALGIPPAQDATTLRGWVRAALERGYRRVKLKVRPGWDLEPVYIAREEMRSARRDVPLWVDANGAYRLDRDAMALRALDGLDLLFIEQPLAADAWWDARELGRELRTPLCLDETIESDDVARQVIAMGGPRIWNIKVQRVGGLAEACRIYARAVAAGIAVWGGTMPETGLGAQAMLALGGHAGFVYPSDIEPSERWYSAGADVIELAMDTQGRMDVPKERVIPRIPPDARLVGEWSA